METACILIFLVIQITFFLKVEAIRCYSCSSNDSQNCVRTKYSDENQITCSSSCVNAILPDNSLYRGCLADLPANVLKKEICDSDHCNANIFPSNRLACHQCFGAECVNVTHPRDVEPYLCRNYIESDTCFTVVESLSNLTRGCSSDPDHLASLYEIKCETPFCNKQPSHEKLTCWECDSAVSDEVACKLGKADDGEIGKCEMDVLLGHPGSCYVLHEAEHVRRGCSNDKVYTAANIHISTCPTSFCNGMEISIHECYQCDSSSNDDCMLLTNNSSIVKCPLGTSSCYACRDFGNIVQRGCGQPEQCIGSCFPCWDGPLCNSNKMYECYSCSAEDNLDCDIFTHHDRVDQQICNQGCQVFLFNNTLHRSCFNESVQCTDQNTCSPCFSDNCNTYFMSPECDVVRYLSSDEEDETANFKHGEKRH